MNRFVVCLLLLFLPTFVVLQTAAAEDPKEQAEATEPQPCMVNDPGALMAEPPLDEGRITVGCPKVWRSDRVFTVLDGLLRDVDSITVKALQGLDPNEANEALIESLVTDFQLKVKYDQGAAANNALKSQQIQAQRQADMDNFKQKQESNKALIEQRKVLADEQLVLRKQELELVKNSKGTDDDAAKLKKVQDQEQTIDTQIAAIDREVSAPAIADQSFGANAATAADDVSKPGTSTALATLPTEFKDTLKNSLKTPTLPAAMRMDNVIELLHERLSREFSIMYDDLSRQANNYDLYLVQFDIGLIPLHRAKNRQARVQLRFTDNRVIAYELYPGASAYNTMRAMDKTTRLGLSGLAQTLFGLGVSAAFNREHNQMRSGLSQSLYVSGFGAGTPTFGWMFGPPPFDNFVNPGIRTVHAMLLVPKDKSAGTDKDKQVLNVDMRVSYCWQKQEKRHSFWFFGEDEECTDTQQETNIRVSLPTEHAPHLVSVSYVPSSKKDVADSTGKADDPIPTNTVQLGFKEPVDPNLTITVQDKIIRRVRDVRGRALFVSGTAADEKLAGNVNETKLLSDSRFGLLESDKLDPDTWMQVNSRTVLLNISKKTAGTDFFPVIRLADPGSPGSDIFALAGDSPGVENVRIGEWEFDARDPQKNGGNPKDLPTSAYLPLFTETYHSGRISTYVDTVDSDKPATLRIISQRHSENRARPIWLHEQAQVILEPKGSNADEERWALHCDQESGTLSCKFPRDIVKNYDRFKVWVDQPPYLQRPGLWADDDLVKTGAKWEPQGYALGDWTDVHEVCTGACNSPDYNWNQWLATVQLRNLEKDTTYCISELAEIPSRLQQLFRSNMQYEPVKVIRNFSAAPSEVCTRQVKGVAQNQTSPVQVDSQEQSATQGKYVSGFVTLAIPFKAFPALPETMHLCKSDAPNCDPITLPNLRSELVPGPLTWVALEDGTYRLEGARLRAVDTKNGILLQGAGKSALLDASVGYDSVDFSPKTKTLDPGLYKVFVKIAGVSVPALKINDKKVEQITLTIPASPAASKAVDGSGH